jgi:hypothetical protein
MQVSRMPSSFGMARPLIDTFQRGFVSIMAWHR